MMPRYRVYRLNSAGKIASTEIMIASSDDEAVAAVEALGVQFRCEIWEGRRFAGRVMPEQVVTTAAEVSF
jgi:hypothetical protein